MCGHEVGACEILRVHDLQGFADREDGVAGERLVDEHAGDAHHGSAAIVALSVELPRAAEDELLLANLLGRAVAEPHIIAIRVARPQPALWNDIPRLLVRVLFEEVDLAERDEEDNLEPRRGRKGRPRGNSAARNVGELDVLSSRQVSREASAAVRSNDAEESRHCQAAVLDLHLNKTAVALWALLANLERIPAAERREHANFVVLRHEGVDLNVGLASHIKEGAS
mmetsp:Transcript_10343/g.22522  ORF Transcript_10343/g.22522 Transcript_10343/m.22522 type:complete len:226 (+) Transcript_10343:339-1016(+)